MMSNAKSLRNDVRELSVEELSEVTGGICQCGCAQEGTAADGRRYFWDKHGAIQWL